MERGEWLVQHNLICGLRTVRRGAAHVLVAELDGPLDARRRGGGYYPRRISIRRRDARAVN